MYIETDTVNILYDSFSDEDFSVFWESWKYNCIYWWAYEL